MRRTCWRSRILRSTIWECSFRDIICMWDHFKHRKRKDKDLPFHFLKASSDHGGLLMILISAGMKVLTPLGQVTCRLALIACSSNLPARALLTNIVQYNGHNGCHCCEGTGASQHSKPLHCWWPFNKDMVLRSNRQRIDCQWNAFNGRTWHTLKVYVFLIFFLLLSFLCRWKGLRDQLFSYFTLILWYARGFMIDVLHCIFLRITKNMLSFWFGKAHAQKPYSIRKR